MVSAQVGGGVTNSILVMAGGVVGAGLYGFFDPWLKPWAEKSMIIKGSVDKHFKKSYTMLALGLGCFSTALAVGLEIAVPWQGELHIPNKPGANIFEMARWPPSVSGAIVGGLNLPLVLLGMCAKSLGSSSAYHTLAAQPLILKGDWRKKFSYLESKRTGFENWWQVVFIGSAVLGTMIILMIIFILYNYYSYLV